MNNKIDLRIIKTKKILFEALVTLMEQKDFEKIKISDICDQALINRSTFYAHYEDKYDLLLAMINDLKNNLERELKENKEEDISKNPHKIVGTFWKTEPCEKWGAEGKEVEVNGRMWVRVK